MDQSHTTISDSVHSASYPYLHVNSAKQAHTIDAKLGNFVVHVPVSEEMLKHAKYKQQKEFQFITYTAVTEETRNRGRHEAESFPDRYQLRQRIFKRDIKIALVITMYNENEKLFIKSMHAVQRNIAFLCNQRSCRFSWGTSLFNAGENGWKNFVVVIVADGRSKVNRKVLDVMEVMGLYVDGIARSKIDHRPVSAHIYEFTTQVSINEDYELLGYADGIVPTQVIFLLKENNAKKINSHKWFFQAVCETIHPEITMLLDVGTRPTDRSLFHLYRAFERNPYVGGACGEIKAELGTLSNKLFNPLVAAQNFEYKMSNILDKPLESVLGYISVLPGAFSAYRFCAIKGRPLEQYFKGEEPGADIFTSNLYLAEDRILCFELVAKKKEPWILKYVKVVRDNVECSSRD
jgi:chitin synthase